MEPRKLIRQGKHWKRLGVGLLAGGSLAALTSCETAVMGVAALGDTISQVQTENSRDTPHDLCDHWYRDMATVQVNGVLASAFGTYESVQGRHVAWSPRPLWMLMQYGKPYDAQGEFDNVFTPADIAVALKASGFKYIEIEGPRYGTTPQDAALWARFGGNTGTDYMHYEISTAGDPNCLVAAASTNTSGLPASVSRTALNPGECVAAHGVGKPAAKYALKIKWEAYNHGGKHLGDEHPQSWSVIDLDADVTSERRDLAYVLRYENHSNVSCPSLASRMRFLRLVQASPPN